MKDDAQVHVLEVILVSGMLLLSLYFVKSFDFSPQSVISKENKLELVGEKILASLEGAPDPSDDFNNLLARYVREGYSTDDLSNFTEYVEQGIPEGAFYSISVINISNMIQNPDATAYSSTTQIVTPSFKIGMEAYASRVVVIKGYAYKVVLGIYFNLR